MNAMTFLRRLGAVLVGAWIVGASHGALAAQAFTDADAAAMRAVLRDAPAHGLESGDDSALRDAPLDDASALRLQNAVLDYARAQHGARLTPSAIDPSWSLTPAPFDADAGFRQALAEGGIATWLAALAPPHQDYQALLAASRRYRAIEADGGWASLPAHPGDDALTVRLQAEGYLPAGEIDAATRDAAVRRFQRAHGLADDGVVGSATLAALNVDVAARLNTIALNLERWRWTPRAFPTQRIMVNIPEARLRLWRDGAVAFETRVIVGARRTPTPMLESAIETVILNPSWTVPTSIARREIDPIVRRDSTYLERNAFSVVDGRYVQAPGPSNALGRVKFDFYNSFGVYLHDTPGVSAFARNDRTLSHGCVRVDDPRGLAEALLAPQGWTRDSIDAAIAPAETQRVALNAWTPIYLVYATAFVDAAGDTHFLRDVYGWDRALARALAARRTRLAATAPATCAGAP